MIACTKTNLIRIDKNTMRDMAVGPDRAEYLAFAAGKDPTGVEMVQGWWDA